MASVYLLLRVIFASIVICYTIADTPANCTYEEIKGTWRFLVGATNFDRSVDCSAAGPAKTKSKTTLTLSYPDVVVDEFGNKGFWTLVYNQGFEVTIHGRKYFAFSKYTGSEKNSTSYCGQTLVGWTHTVGGKQWGCYVGHKLTAVPPKYSADKSLLFSSKQLFKPDAGFVAEVNRVQKTWKAVLYRAHQGMTVGEVLRRSGGRASLYSPPGPATVTASVRRLADRLPAHFDWRDVGGQSFVPDVRDQGGCGSCYAFASVGLNEARLRIITNNTAKLTFSPQDIVECSRYSQGCDGGFPYLVGGKYAQDYGLVEESCNPYTGKTTKCATGPLCRRYYTDSYRYVGGYYGGCNEALMRLALVSRGPLAVSFEVYPDFMHYDGGVYRYSGVASHFNPFHLTNHAVLLVGYGVDASTSLPYWIVENSWGPKWGEDGFFRIVRGVNECAIESIAVESTPVF